MTVIGAGVFGRPATAARPDPEEAMSEPTDELKPNWFGLGQLDRMERKLDAALASLRQLKQEVENRMSQLDDKITELTAKVAAETTVVDSAVTFINGLPALIAAAVQAALAQGATPAQLQAITDLGARLDSEGAALAAAITANTPTPPATPLAKKKP